MKKNLFIAIAVLFFACPAFAQNTEYLNDCLSYTSANSLKYELNSIKRQVNNNNYKIRNIKSSKNLSEYEKKRQIQRLENKNRYYEREMHKIKRDYTRALS